MILVFKASDGIDILAALARHAVHSQQQQQHVCLTSSLSWDLMSNHRECFIPSGLILSYPSPTLSSTMLSMICFSDWRPTMSHLPIASYVDHNLGRKEDVLANSTPYGARLCLDAFHPCRCWSDARGPVLPIPGQNLSLHRA